MKKALLILFLGISMSLGLTACDSSGSGEQSTSESIQENQQDIDNKNNQQEQSKENNQQEQSKENNNQEENEDNKDEKNVDAIKDTNDFSSMELYQNFLDGKEKLYIEPGRFTEYCFDEESEEYQELDMYADNDGYILSQFLMKFVENVSYTEYEELFVNKVFASYIDCGNDNEPELLLRVEFSNRFNELLQWEFIIKNKDGKLYLVDQENNGYRYSCYIANNYGKIVHSGSEGADAIYYAEYYLNRDGEKKLAYQVEESYWGQYSLEMDERFKDISFDDLKEEYLYLSIYSFATYDLEDESSYFQGLMYCAEVSSEYEAYDNIDYEANLKIIQEIFDTAGVKLYTRAEIDALLQIRYEELGISDDMKEYEEIETTEVSIDVAKVNGWEEVTVSNVQELMDAIGEKKYITLKPGTYNVSDWLVGQIKNGKIDPLYTFAEPYSDELIEAPLEDGKYIYYGYSENSPAWTLRYLKNCYFFSEDSKNPAIIVSEPRECDVLFLMNCCNIQFHNIVMGHTQQAGTCEGDVVHCLDSERITFDGCDLYGCGAIGLSIGNSYQISVFNSVIHDCTVGAIYAYNTYGVDVENTSIRDIDGYQIIDIYNGSIYLENCIFENLKGDFVQGNSFSMYFEKCKVPKELMNQLKQMESYTEYESGFSVSDYND